MQRLLTVILILGIAFLGLNCQKEVSFTGPGTGNNNPNPITATVQGNIKDDNGRPAIGVTVKVGSKMATTDARGYFRITNAALDKKASLVTAEKTGYFKAFRTFGATSGTNQVTIQLLKKTLTGSVTTGAGGEVSLSNGSKVKLPVNGIVKKSGGTYSGTVNVYATYIDPTSSTISELVPGSFMAIDKNNNQVVLSSYGMLAVELESPAGEKLQVAAGSVATLTTAIPAALQSSAPTTIPLWYVDEQTGIWKEEGTATKNGNNYVGDVKHFSFWNCDIPFPSINLSMTLMSPHGAPLANALVKLTSASTYGTAYGYTDNQGQVNGAVPSNMALTLEVLDPCFNTAYTQSVGPFSSNTNLGTIITSNNTNTVTITGRLLNCSGAPVTNGHALIILDNMTRYASTANDGTFSLTLYTCATSSATCEVIGIDNTTHQQGLPVNVTITHPMTTSGDLTACGTSAVEYINYSLDGTISNITNLNGAYLTAHCYDSVGLRATYIIGGDQVAGHYFYLNFVDNRAPGVFPVDNVDVNTSNVITLVQPFNVTITSFPAAGGFIEGNFSGQFLDGNGLHTLISSFRVRRQ